MRDEQKTVAIASTLPRDRDALLAIAQQARQDIHNAILAGDFAAATLLVERDSAVIWLLNGETFFGSLTDEGAGTLIAEQCRAPDGHVPMWLQAGTFLVEVEGMRCVVNAKRGYGLFDTQLELNAVDVDHPFISDTGYRSAFIEPQPMPVDAAARCYIERMAIEYGRKFISRDAWCRHRNPFEEWPWLAGEPVPSDTFVEKTGQVAFAF